MATYYIHILVLMSRVYNVTPVVIYSQDESAYDELEIGGFCRAQMGLYCVFL